MAPGRTHSFYRARCGPDELPVSSLGVVPGGGLEPPRPKAADFKFAASADFAIRADGVVPRAGLEPARPEGHCPLKTARLPVPPPGQVSCHCAYRGFSKAVLACRCWCPGWDSNPHGLWPLASEASATTSSATRAWVVQQARPACVVASCARQETLKMVPRVGLEPTRPVATGF